MRLNSLVPVPRDNRLGGFWEDLLQTGERIATSVLDRTPTGVYTPSTFPAGTYPTFPQQVQAVATPANTLLFLGGAALVVYLLMNRGRR